MPSSTIPCRPFRAAAGFLLLGAALLSAQTAPAPSPTRRDAEKEAATQQLEPVEVTGSRIKRVETEGASPIRIITREDLEIAGRASLADALREMPEAGFSAITESGTVSAVRGSTALNLRELGANNTLIIVNGRRAVLTGQNDLNGTTFVDLNRFPVAMVERVEVLKDGASAVYGADATAGVVNIILRKDYRGTDVSFFYGNATNSDVGEQAWSMFTGAAKGKLSGTLGLTFYRRAGLRGVDTDFASNADLSARYAAKDPIYAGRVAAGFYDLRSGTGPQARVAVAGSPVNGQNGVSIPGLPPGFPIVRLPGTGGIVSGLGLAATPSFTNPSRTGTGGQFSAPITATYVPQVLTPQSNPSNLYNFQESVWLLPEANRAGLHGAVRYDVRRNLNLYGEFSFQKNKSHIELAAPPISTVTDNGIVVPRTNHWNPFGVDIQFEWRPVDFGPRRSDVTNETYHVLTGAKGNIGDRWDWDVGYTYGHDRTKDRSSNMISESRLRQVLARSTPNALNIFGGAGFRNDPAVYDEIRVTTETGGYATLALADAKVSGELFALPTGPLGFAFYSEWRKEKFGEKNDPFSSTLNDIIAQVRSDDPSDARRTIKSVATEFRLPLVKPGVHRFVHKADLNLAARFEDFSDGYDSGLKPAIGLRYQPTANLVLRVTYTEAFRAPTLSQLYGGLRESLVNNLPDFRRPQALTGDPFDGVATQRRVQTAGNRGLTPEVARGYQCGFVYDVPIKQFKGLTLRTTFFEIEQTNVITQLGAGYIRLNEVGGGTGSLVVRDPSPEVYANRTTSPIPILVGPSSFGLLNPGQLTIVPGRIRSISDSVLNLASLKVNGYDFEVNYAKRSPTYGRFSFRAGATYLRYFDLSATREMENQAGRDGLPRVRAQGSLIWQRKQWTGGFVQNYIGEYGDFVRNGFEVDSHYTTGIFAAYEIPPGRVKWLENTRLTLGLDNVFDRDPPLYANSTSIGYDQRFIGRPAGRFWFVGLKRTL